MRRRCGLVLLCALVLAPAAGWAQEPGPAAPVEQASSETGYLPYNDPQPMEGVNVWGALARSVIALGFVLGLMGGTVVLLRRVLPGVVGGPGAGPVRLLGRVPLSPKQVVYFLEMPGRILVVGSGGGQLSALAEITNPDEIAELLRAAPGLTAVSTPFGGLLQRRLQQAGAGVRAAAAGPEDAGLDGIRRHIAHLRTLARPEAK